MTAPLLATGEHVGDIDLARFADQLGDVFWISDPRSRRVVYVSPSYERLWGRPREQLYERFDEWIDAVHPDDRDRVREAFFVRVYEGAYDEEYRIIRPDGSLRWVRDRGFPLYVATGEIDRVAGIAEDITTRKRVEQELARLLDQLAFEREQLSAVVQQMPAGVIVAEAPTGRIILGNALVAEIWRHPLVAAPTIADYAAYRGFHLDGQPYRPEEWPLARALRAGEVVVAEEIDFVRGDETRGTMEVSAAPIHDAAGRITAAVVTFLDVTARRQIEGALRRSQARFRVAQDLSLDAFTILRAERDGYGRIVDFVWEYANAAAARVLLRPVAELVGRRLLDVLPENRSSGLFDQYVRVVETGIPHDIELYYDGEGITGWFRNMTVKLDDGVAISFHDITARKRAELVRALLAETSKLLATSLSYEQTVEQIVRLAVPAFADQCALDFLQPDGTLRRQAVAGAPAGGSPGWVLGSGPPAPGTAHPVWRAIASGEPAISPEIGPESPRPPDTERKAHDPVVSGATWSAISLPLLARGRTLGAISFGLRRASRPYVLDDLPLAQELASRAALALDNARLYHEAQVARKAAEQMTARTARLQAVTAALAEALTPEQVAAVIVEQTVAAFGAHGCSVSQLSEDGRWLEVVGLFGYTPDVATRWQHLSVDAAAPLAEAVRERAPIFLESRAAIIGRYPTLVEKVERLDERAWAIVPLEIKGRPIGAFRLAFAEDRTFGEEDLAFLLALMQHCAQALDRARLYSVEQRARLEAEEARRRQSFLVEASTVLAASLDYQERLTRLARLLVPYLADYCLLYVVEPDGLYRQAALAHVDRRKEGLLEELGQRYRVDLANPNSRIAQVLRSSAPLLVEEASFAQAQAISQDTRLHEIYRALDPCSYMIVPLIAGAQVRGVLFLVSAESRRRYGSADLELVLDLAPRAAVALENARLHQETAAAVRARDVFLSIASHELRTPLTSLLGNAQLLRRRAARTGAFSERDIRAITAVADQAERLNKMVSALLDVSRLERGQLAIERAPIDLVALARSVVEETLPLLDRHSLGYAGEQAPLPVEGDAVRLAQVLHNLVQNAVKYSPRGGAITVAVERRDRLACVSVADQGIGIPREALPQLFSRFYRAANAAAQHIGGLGIGLFVVKEIVSLHGGTVGVASEEGQGSTFTICLPLLSQ